MLLLFFCFACQRFTRLRLARVRSVTSGLRFTRSARSKISGSPACVSHVFVRDQRLIRFRIIVVLTCASLSVVCGPNVEVEPPLLAMAGFFFDRWKTGSKSISEGGVPVLAPAKTIEPVFVVDASPVSEAEPERGDTAPLSSFFDRYKTGRKTISEGGMPVLARTKAIEPVMPGTGEGVVATSHEPAVCAKKTAVAILQAPTIPLTPTCSKCKRLVDPLRAVMTGKCSGVWKCHSCNVKSVQLHRMFGSWPPRSFQALPADWQTKFWKDVEGKSGGADLEKFVVDSITRERAEQEFSKHGGEYLPLSVYATRGFNVADIEEKCKDTDMHDVLGKTYRVAIKGVWSTAIEQMVRKELMSGRRDQGQGPPSKKARAICSGEPAKDDDDADSDDREEPSTIEVEDTAKDSGKKKKKKKKKESSSSDSTSSSDSSTSESDSPSPAPKKASKKSKKSATKKHRKKELAKKKRQEKLAKATAKAEKAKALETKAAMRLAARTLAKTGPLLAVMRTGFSDLHLKNVPKFAAEPAKKSLKLLEAVHDKAEACINSHGTSSCSWTVEQLDADCKLAAQNAALLTKMLETARKHAAAT